MGKIHTTLLKITYYLANIDILLPRMSAILQIYRQCLHMIFNKTVTVSVSVVASIYRQYYATLFNIIA